VDNAVEKVKKKISCETIKDVIRSELASELEWMRPDMLEGMTKRICIKVQAAMADDSAASK